jgi:lysophospholipase L1-like esterase
VKKAAYALLTLALVFAAGELILRAFGYRGDPRVVDFRFQITGDLIGEPDPVRFWRLPNVAPHFQGAAPRIICLADSVTVMEHGRGWPELLPDALRAAGYAKPAQVFNAGVPEYTSYQGLRYFETELLATRPNIVTVEFGWNDHWPSPVNRPDSAVQVPRPTVFALHQHLIRLRLYRLLRTAILPAPNPKVLRVPPDDYRQNLRRIAELVRGQGGQMILLTAPYLDNPFGWVALHRTYIDATRQAAGELQAPLVDLADVFLHRRDLFLDPRNDQCHFNKSGAEIVAQAVAAVIVQKGWLP